MIWDENQLVRVTACGMCGSSDLRAKGCRADGLPLDVCGRCGFVFLGTRPCPEAMADYYDRTYFQGSDTYQDYFGYARAVTQLGYCPRLHRLSPFIQDWRSKRVLEIGCAAGSTLALIQRQGGMVEGIEISATAAAVARDCFRLPVFNGPFEEAVLAPGAYDCVLMFDVLEHLAEPGRAIDRVASILKDGGVFALTVPNFDRYAVEGDRWPGIGSWFEHVNYFESAVLCRRMDASGFEVLEQHTYTAGLDRKGRPESVALRAFKSRLKQGLPDVLVRAARRVRFMIKGPPCLDVRRDKGGMDLFVFARKRAKNPPIAYS